MKHNNSEPQSLFALRILQVLWKYSDENHGLIQREIIEKLESNESNVRVTVFQGIPKSDKMEYIIQKAVELGAYDIVPVEMKYCVAKIKLPDLLLLLG